MKKIKIILWLCLPLLIFSCLKEDNETLVLNQINQIDKVIPVQYRLEMEEYMPFYNGKTPPNIEGIYLISKDKLVYSSDGLLRTGFIFSDLYLKFSSQDEKSNILSYASKAGNSSDESDSVFIIGSDDNFTVYFISTGTSYGIYTKEANVISGTITSSGIRNIYQGFVMLDKGSDIKNKVIDVGTFRILTDGDSLAENSIWNKSTKITDVNSPFEMAKNLLKYDNSKSN
jgi:hypothetical protein